MYITTDLCQSHVRKHAFSSGMYTSPKTYGCLGPWGRAPTAVEAPYAYGWGVDAAAIFRPASSARKAVSAC